MSTTWECQQGDFDTHSEWHDVYFWSISPVMTIDYEGSTIDASVCKECGSLVLANHYAADHLSDHRAWHDKMTNN